MPWQPLRCAHLPNKLGFDGYDQFKQVFQSTINDPSFESRASWVQQSSEAEGLPSVVHDLAESGYNNIQHFYQNLDMQAIRQRRLYVTRLGMGVLAMLRPSIIPP